MSLFSLISFLFFFVFSVHSGVCEATHCVCDKGWTGDYCDTTTATGPTSGAAASVQQLARSALALSAALWALQCLL